MADVNSSMAHLSDTLFTTAIFCYAAAMVGFTAEYAFGRRGRVATTARVSRRELVEVSAGGTTTTAPTASRSRPAAAGARRWRAERWGRWALITTIVGLLIHVTSVAVRAIAVDAVPWSNMYEFASVAGLVAVTAFVALLWKAPQVRYLGGFVLLPVILLMFLAGTVLYSKAQPLEQGVEPTAHFQAVALSIAGE